ncbi:uncharacterized protein KD926_010312 [Aspergillus affinis]|uniref:uncharacterized protein n=1 Tax=Aspergillus affinis TaxID=1070780 RepID=UPI0022FDDDDB|nr:uncharacterized protein KD926_010312 [Aspergillus affinis]KAI9044989.1 hypothetical protein KD926_010312 [Aspergillus affinis]
MPYKYPIHPFPIPPVPASALPTQADYIQDRNAITEIIFLRFRPNTPIEDPSTSAGKLWAQALDLIRGSEKQGIQPSPGLGRFYWGRAEGGSGVKGGDDDVVLLIIDWDDLTLHTKSQSPSALSSITKTLSPILLSLIRSSISVKFTTHPPLTATSISTPPYPVTALTIAKFPTTMDPAEKAQIPSLWQYTRQDLFPRGEQLRYGCLGAAGGWGTIVSEGSGGDGSGEGGDGLGAGAETGTGTGGWYVMLDIWEGKERREEWARREEAELLKEKWEERATEGMETWFGKLRMWKTGKGSL